jgi:hypothetical protein
MGSRRSAFLSCQPFLLRDQEYIPVMGIEKKGAFGEPPHSRCLLGAPGAAFSLWYLHASLDWSSLVWDPIEGEAMADLGSWCG